MAALTIEDLQRIAHLARLEPDQANQEQLLAQLNGFFELVEQMQTVHTNDIEPLYTPLSIAQDVHLRLREDKVTETTNEATRDLAQRNAPAAENGFFLVPKVIE
ncbi:Glutamyl-tRNA(Gln) amidotransferase subunit C [Saezia sanguinis]|uniref:Aspartyl/glutamyl-tRNA(Asn/Gln) amidotransferase subunit C n=1 Tax=Saezia sanguinis TaxID=1965230 RepID=A0A433SA37_9BURK|nr:Asp-tRNA(Asn)/Glu-tRNA(Gln) amidotransferase subunit GatC [Saezia sanguinis]RUS65534.1 Glutamyl-tRNA(Gln) amidotransferase subunit C [Saezia sanguinis]